VHDILNIRFTKKHGDEVSLKVLNLAGQLLIEKTFSNVEQYALNISSLVAGTYSITFSCKSFNETFKFVKQ